MFKEVDSDVWRDRQDVYFALSFRIYRSEDYKKKLCFVNVI